MAKEQRIGRQRAVSELKRGLIMEAARRVFEAEGLDGASRRAIAMAAGYTPAALYFHFASKEAIYAEVLRESLMRLESINAPQPVANTGGLCSCGSGYNVYSDQYSGDIYPAR